jgi:hypothetical protein
LPASGGGGGGPPLELLLPPLELPPELLEVVPPSCGGGGGLPPQGPQTPTALPGCIAHEKPGQQSALLVQEPHCGTQLVVSQMKRGVPASPGLGLGMHGRWLQQLALEAHPPPAGTHVAGAHRGTPTLSCLHVSIVSQLPAQQSHDALQLIVLSLHTSPSGLQLIGLRQTPRPPIPPSPETVQVTLPAPAPPMPAEPQQSLSCVQRSPTTWQPLAGWHTSTPVGPKGAHARLQQPPPHAGRPPSL